MKGSPQESSSPDWFLSARLVLYLADREVEFESAVDPGLGLEAHTRSAWDVAEAQGALSSNVVSAALSVLLRISRNAVTTPPLNLPDDLVEKLASIRTTIDIDSYLVEPDKVPPLKRRVPTE